MHPALERIRDRSRLLLTLNYFAGQVRYRLGLRSHLSGATHLTHSVEEGAEYVTRVFRDYLAVSGLRPDDLAGQRILEVGPGDNLGVSLLFAAHGAAEVTCLDRFAPARDEAKNHAIYQALLADLEPDRRARAREVLGAGSVPGSPVRLRRDLAIEAAAAALPAASYDCIVSRAVLEHVFDPAAAWSSMDALAAPGARLIHKIDFRNHGFYESLHPLAFLKTPGWLWPWLSSPDPTLNRHRASSWESLAIRSGYMPSITVTHLSLEPDELPLGALRWPLDMAIRPEREALARLRPQLASPFNTSTLDDLAVAGIFLVARKPGRRDMSPPQ
jgi:2-polyprenyl-3-methyl-5-hydroxy-6-metoxy-1,4-benzoquinol methylase